MLDVFDGQSGYPSQAPYDRIHVGAAIPHDPQTLKEQLKVTHPGVCWSVREYVTSRSGRPFRSITRSAVQEYTVGLLIALSPG